MCLGRSVASGAVAIQGKEDAGLAEICDSVQGCGLAGGKRCAARSQPGVPSGVCGGDSDGIERALDDDGYGAVGESATRLVQAEQ